MAKVGERLKMKNKTSNTRIRAETVDSVNLLNPRGTRYDGLRNSRNSVGLDPMQSLLQGEGKTV
jgi:hypothetical protein